MGAQFADGCLMRRVGTIACQGVLVLQRHHGGKIIIAGTVGEIPPDFHL